MKKVIETLKWAGALMLLLFLFMLPAFVGMLAQNGLPTARELCRDHRGVEDFNTEGHFMSVDSARALCRDGTTGEVATE